MVNQVTTREYELNAYEFEAGSKSFRLAEMTYGGYVVTSWSTADPTAKSFWGCKSFRSIAEIESHYKSLRGIAVLLAA